MADVDVQGILALLSRYGYFIVALAAVAEALPLLGWLVPGQAIIILAGAAAAAGYLNLVTIILIAIPAGIVGDGVGFYIGRRYGRIFLEKYGHRVRIGPRHLERSDALFQKYGSFALVVARFSFLTRAVGPILAGMARMRQRVFWTVNLVGAVAWAVAYAVLGFFFGIGFLYLQSTIGRILALTLVAAVSLYLFYRLLKRYAAQFTRDDLYLALTGSAAGTAFGIIADRVQKLGRENAIDLGAGPFADYFAPLAPLLAAVDVLTSFAVLGAVSLVLCVYFFLRKRWWEATLVAMGVGGIILIVETLRPIFRALLPPGPGDAFPSENAAIPLVLAGVLSYLVAMRATRARAPLLAAIVGGGVSGIVAFARLGQGVEYPSSVLGGMTLGIAWLCVTVLVVEFRLKR